MDDGKRIVDALRAAAAAPIATKLTDRRRHDLLAAFASQRSPRSKAFYDRQRAEGDQHAAAPTCLARRRCDVILAMLGNRQHYRLLSSQT